jgi:hypothetical protein
LHGIKEWKRRINEKVDIPPELLVESCADIAIYKLDCVEVG